MENLAGLALVPEEPVAIYLIVHKRSKRPSITSQKTRRASGAHDKTRSS